MLSYIEAITKVFAVLPQPAEEIREVNHAARYYLAEDVYAQTELPGFDNSSMDGYALISKDTILATAANPVRLRIIGSAPAGHPFEGKVNSGQAVYINTGSVIPAGTDAVIPIEHVESISQDEILVTTVVPTGKHIRFSGEEIQPGELVFKKSEYLSPAHLGLLSSLGITHIKTFKRPVVGFLATGDELIQAGKQPGPGQVRNSNTTIIRAMVESRGNSFHDYGLTRDSKSEIIEKIQSNPLPDIMITSAGVSMGEHDLVVEALESIGLKVHFWRVAIKPGKPLVFGTIGATLFFGLPGNPVSGAVVFRQFIEPVMRAISGAADPFRLLYKARSEDEFRVTAGRLHFARGIAKYSDGWVVRSAGAQGSHILSSLAQSNCSVLIPPDKEIIQGEEVYIQLYNGTGTGINEFTQSFSLLLK